MAVAEPSPAACLTLVCGPSGSGKSRWAEYLASRSTANVIYVATGPCQPQDSDWQQRLERHRIRRPATWSTKEVQGDLTQALLELQVDELGLVDSLGTWVAAHLDLQSDEWEQLQRELLVALNQCPAELVLVCEEVAWGVVPATALGCRFRDRLSEINRRVAQRCSAHWLVVQGRALNLSVLGIPVPDLS